MADVRNLLRDEQASRRISHPHLSYTKSGVLNCTVCHLLIKAESLWEGHLRSPNHKKNEQNLQNGETADGNASRKRKTEDDREDARKKTKSVKGVPENLFDTHTQNSEVQPQPVATEILERGSTHEKGFAEAPLPEQTTRKLNQTKAASQSAYGAVNEDEWAAFEREVVPLTHNPAPARDYISATISAAPMSVADIASQTAVEQKPRRDLEAEDEKEEEENRMAEEFEVMEELEGRVKRLKEKREALRIEGLKRVDGNGKHSDNKISQTGGAGAGFPAPHDRRSQNSDEAEDEDGSEDFDEWGFS